MAEQTQNKKQEYYTLTEENDYKLFKQFNDQVLHLSQFGRTPSKWHYDVSGYTKDGRYVEVEIKSRNQVLLEDTVTVSGTSSSNKSYQDSTLMIESSKVGDLALDIITNPNTIALYANFLNDGSLLIFNLQTLKRRPNRNIGSNNWSSGHQSFEKSIRQMLHNEDSTVYKLINGEYKTIRKPL